MGRLNRVVSDIRWTEQVIADDVAPDTDKILYVGNAEEIYIQWDTTNVSTNAPSFDIHVEASWDGVTFTGSHYATLASGVLEDVVGGGLVTPGPKQLRLRLDVNDANLAAGEYVVCNVFIRDKMK